jgi:hypothetical protein
MKTEQQEESFMEQLQAVRAANARVQLSLCWSAANAHPIALDQIYF